MSIGKAILICVVLAVLGLFELAVQIALVAALLALVAIVITSPVWIIYYIVKFLDSLCE